MHCHCRHLLWASENHPGLSLQAYYSWTSASLIILPYVMSVDYTSVIDLSYQELSLSYMTILLPLQHTQQDTLGIGFSRFFLIPTHHLCAMDVSVYTNGVLRKICCSEHSSPSIFIMNQGMIMLSNHAHKPHRDLSYSYIWLAFNSNN